MNRLTVSTLITSVIALMATTVVAVLAVAAWTSWEQLGAAHRISVIAESSAHTFKAMHNMRAERVAALRSLNADTPAQPDFLNYMRGLRDAEVPSIRRAIALLERTDFQGKGMS